MYNFTDEQKNLIDFVLKEYKQQPYLTLGGVAGSGKSTCLAHLHNKLANFKVCAYTGKAANVLRKKGIANAATIHSTIYEYYDNEGELEFRRKFKNEIDFSGLFVDEASMVSEDIFDDLLSFGVPIIFFGDHGQLEPVQSKFNLMKSPQVVLETIHRNANTIAKFADFLRKGNDAKSFKEFDDTVQLLPKRLVKTEDFTKTDQVICAFNKTRNLINRKVREFLGYEKTVVKNEKIICLKHNKKLGIFNGMQGTVLNTARNIITFKDDTNNIISVKAFMPQFGVDKLHESANNEKDKGYFDYGYCITCHKAQGDEWNRIIVIEEKCDLWDHRRWAYTAASRAKTNIVWAI
jgi:exodeoxyribonuclease-5